MRDLVNKKRMLEEFLELVQIDSPSGREGRIKEVLMRKLSDLGFEVHEDDAGRKTQGEAGNLIGRIKGTLEGPSIFFCAHMDTVQPGTGIKPIVEGDLVKSSGDTVLGGDDKAGIVVLLEALRLLGEKEMPHPPLEVLFTVSEEQGLMGAKHLDFSRLSSTMGYVLDTVGDIGTVVIQGPAQNEIEIEIKGRAAHAGINPEEGLNAICLAAHAIEGLSVGRIDEATTCNLGVIMGGQARNIVPERVVIKGEARSLVPEKLEQITEEMARIFRERVEEKGGQVTFTSLPLYPAFQLREDEKVVTLAVRAAESLGLRPKLIRSGGGSDANILNSQGFRAANLAVGMRSVHTTEEYVVLGEMVDAVCLILKIIELAGEMGVARK